MKRAAHILLLLSYLFFTVGINIASHYCGEYLVTVQVVTTNFNSEPEDCCSEPCSDDCCQNKIITIKIQNSQKAEVVNPLDKLAASDLPKAEPYYNIPLTNSVVFSSNYSNSPPGVKTYILNSTFLI